MTLPILYSFVRCPYAIRARMACAQTGTEVELREVNLKDKPQALLNASPKGSVPVFIHANGRVVDESQAIVTEQLQGSNVDCDHPNDKQLIDGLHATFIPALKCYKYPERHPESDRDEVIATLNEFLSMLDKHLVDHELTEDWSYLDVMVLPLIRQCYIVDPAVFSHWQHTHVEHWLQQIISSTRFKTLMEKRIPWNSIP